MDSSAGSSLMLPCELVTVACAPHRQAPQTIRSTPAGGGSHDRPRRGHVDSVEVHFKNPRVMQWYPPASLQPSSRMIDSLWRCHGPMGVSIPSSLARVSQQLDSPGFSAGAHEKHERANGCIRGVTRVRPIPLPVVIRPKNCASHGQ